MEAGGRWARVCPASPCCFSPARASSPGLTCIGSMCHRGWGVRGRIFPTWRMPDNTGRPWAGGIPTQGCSLLSDTSSSKCLLANAVTS